MAKKKTSTDFPRLQAHVAARLGKRFLTILTGHGFVTSSEPSETSGVIPPETATKIERLAIEQLQRPRLGTLRNGQCLGVFNNSLRCIDIPIVRKLISSLLLEIAQVPLARCHMQTPRDHLPGNDATGVFRNAIDHQPERNLSNLFFGCSTSTCGMTSLQRDEMVKPSALAALWHCLNATSWAR